MPKPSALSVVVDADAPEPSSLEATVTRQLTPALEQPSPSSPRAAFTSKPATKKPQYGRTAPPSSTLESSQRGHPYKNNSASSIASRSHGNLLETASIGSNSVHEDAISETSQSLPRPGGESNRERKPSKHHRIQNMLSRSRSQKQDLANARQPPKVRTSDRIINSRSRERRDPTIQESPQTAPLSPDRGFRDAMESSSSRNRSADRMAHIDEDQEVRNHGPGRFQHLVTSSSKAAGDLSSRIGKGFAKIGQRSNSTTEREEPEADYVFQIINLPLVDQVRKTRLRKTLAESKDKTEFWLPALPYRCIDFLNSKGVEEEGLYRVGGSVREVKLWQIRFDKQKDINLLDEPDFDDIYTIGTMLKGWLRELPDEIFPKATQAKIARECAEYQGGETAPTMLKEELSKLPPFNYYLLFAITAHITLLSKFSDINKMTYNNLCICFQPCIGIDSFAFHFLVKDWRNCWQGCLTEKDYLEKEGAILSMGDPSTSTASIASASTKTSQAKSSSHQTTTSTTALPSNDTSSQSATLRPKTAGPPKVPARSPERKPVPSTSASEPIKTNGSSINPGPPTLAPVDLTSDSEEEDKKKGTTPETREAERLNVETQRDTSTSPSPSSANDAAPAPELNNISVLSPMKM